jgi:hypothetical protein
VKSSSVPVGLLIRMVGPRPRPRIASESEKEAIGPRGGEGSFGNAFASRASLEGFRIGELPAELTRGRVPGTTVEL